MLKQTISRVLFPEVSFRAMVIPLEKRLPAPSSDLPGSYGRTTLLMLLYLVLLRVGFTKHLMSPSGLVSSYLTVSPLPLWLTGINPSQEAVYFLWHFPSRHRDSVLRSTLSCGARTFLSSREFGTSDHFVCFSRFICFKSPVRLRRGSSFTNHFRNYAPQNRRSGYKMDNS